MDRIRKISRFCQICFLIIFCLLPVSVTLFWIFINELHAAYGYVVFLNASKKIELFTNWPITLNMKVVGLIGELIYVCVLMAIFYFLTKLFGLYSRGHIFTRENVRYIRLIGYAFIWKPILTLPTYWILSYAMYMNNPVSIKTTYSYFDSNDILIGLIIIIVSWVMDEGRKLQEEQSLII